MRAREWLISDATSLVDRFTSLAGASLLRLSLGAVRDDQCRRFHVDYLRLRLVTTYAGPGTEWLPEEAVDREALERVGCSPAEANRHIVRDPSARRCAGAGDVLLMKGSRYPSLHGGGAVHRSPPIDGTGQTRIVLVVSTFDPPA